MFKFWKRKKQSPPIPVKRIELARPIEFPQYYTTEAQIEDPFEGRQIVVERNDGIRKRLVEAMTFKCPEDIIKVPEPMPECETNFGLCGKTRTLTYTTIRVPDPHSVPNDHVGYDI